MTGDVIFAEGDTSAEMFIVQEGTVAVTKTGGRPRGVPRHAGTRRFLRRDGDAELAAARHATCDALTPTRLLAIRSGELLIKLRRDPTFALEMLAQMSRRLAYLEEQVAELMEDQLEARQTLAKAMAKSEFRTDEPTR